MKIKKFMLVIVLILIIVGIIIGIDALNKDIESVTKVTTTKNEQNETSTNNNTTNSEDTVTLGENLFMTQLNDIYLNYSDYEGKTIELIGFTFNDWYSESLVVGREYYCCGTDAYIIGFECGFDDTSKEIEYEDDVWVRVVGTIILKETDEGTYPTILINTIEETEEGTRTVWY